MSDQIQAATMRQPRTASFSVLAFPLLALAGCDMVVMNPTGDIAIQQRNLILIATGLMLLIIVPVMVLIVLFAVRYRKGGRGAYDPHFQHSTPLELVIWACPLLIIICLGAVTWSSTHLLDPFRPLERIAAGVPIPPGTQTLEVQVVAMDWKWLFIYPAQGIATVNELVLPVDVPVRFTITSTNQMNTFYAPTLAGMIYAMPGMQSVLHAVLNKPGESWGFSGNYTGSGFSGMRFQLRGTDQAGFDRWTADVRQGGAALAAGSYLALAKPTEKNPVAHFATVSAGLFDRVVNRCVEPGRPCMSDVMRHDRHEGAAMDEPRQVQPGPHPAGLDVPSSHGSMPMPQDGRPHGHDHSARPLPGSLPAALPDPLPKPAPDPRGQS
jgi:cytochrome o ubiquinol oxidase subunit 2